jgi:outer membrane lipopolysaccharide assembly protein LptE/RlpB
MRIRTILLLFAVFALLYGCGYELVTGSGLSGPAYSGPGMGGEKITSLNVPVFKNKTFEPQVPQFFTEAFSQELAGSGLVQINRSASDPILQGTVTSVSASISALTGQGLAIQKVVTVYISLTLAREGNVVKTWTFGDAEPYDASTINTEDFNKRAAEVRIAERMARRFHALLLSGY